MINAKKELSFMHYNKMTSKIVLFSISVASFLLGAFAEAQEATVPSMNVIYHPVSTENAEAQKYFDEGLTSIYAFNHDEAYRYFEKAAELDPNLGMAYWGMALALGQNINRDVTPENEIKAYNLIQKAIKLSTFAPDYEQAYINALAKRYTNDPDADFVPLRYTYRNAMKKLMEHYPEDLDAATLYTESILDLDPWKYWSKDGVPSRDILEAINVLESVLRRAPDHIGANHYLIHAYEESPYPERALMSAHRLETLLPASGHLLHMPSHIYILVGDYDKAVASGKKAIQADRNYMSKEGSGGYYPFHYLSHNLIVLTRVYMLLENYENALKTARELEAFVNNHNSTDPHTLNYQVVPLELSLYFHKWDDLIKNPGPKSQEPFIQAYWHFSRSMAFANQGDYESAEKEKSIMLQLKDKIPGDWSFRNNPGSKVFDLAHPLLNAAIAKAKNQSKERIRFLHQAVQVEDSLNYDEPPVWYIPSRLSLGAALLQEKQYSDAEDIFRDALRHLARNGRLLFGLHQSLQRQGRPVDSFWVEREMQDALKHSDISLSIPDL
jgi:tetratricopeptide (TPR) repeat protein